MITTALKLIEKLRKDPEYAQDVSELRAEILSSQQLPEVAYVSYRSKGLCSSDELPFNARTHSIGIDSSLAEFENAIIFKLFKLFPESSLGLILGKYDTKSTAWKSLKRYAQDQLFGVWGLASGQPLPKKSMILVERSELVKQLRVVEKLLLDTLSDFEAELSEDSEKRLQEAFRLLVEMRK